MTSVDTKSREGHGTLDAANDDGRVQHRLAAERFGIEHIRLVAGWSMGARQSVHRRAMDPDTIDVAELEEPLASRRPRPPPADRRRPPSRSRSEIAP